jgi:mono/diheme cytochrome c family protein/nitrate/TMAO reductase-like tetraheme cytochrome c subunit
MKLPERSRLPENLEIPGLYPRRRRMPHWPVWLWLVIAVVAAIPLVGLPGVVLAHYTTSNSEFCLTCHGTGETPDRSVPSDVHPNFDQVTCVDCHAKSGQLVFEGYVKGFQAEPERVSSNCVRCHPAMAEKTTTQGFKFNARGITIDHSAHIQRGATCVTCHADIAHDLQEPKTNRPKMDSCYTCHSRTDSCVKCHGSSIPAPAASRETIGRKPVVAPPTIPTPVQAPPTAKPVESAEPITTAPTTQAAASTVPAAAAAPAPPPTSIPTQAKPTVDTASLDEGRALFAKTCTMCHGPDGGMLTSVKLNSKSYLQGYGVDALVQSTTGGKGGMPAFGIAKGGPLSDQQVKAVVEYLVSAAN